MSYVYFKWYSVAVFLSWAQQHIEAAGPDSYLRLTFSIFLKYVISSLNISYILNNYIFVPVLKTQQCWDPLLVLLWWGRQLPLLSQIRKDQLSLVTSLNAWGKGSLWLKIWKIFVWSWASCVTIKLVYSFLQFGRYLSCRFMQFVTSKHLYKTCRVTVLTCLKTGLFYLIKAVTLFVTPINSSLCLFKVTFVWSLHVNVLNFWMMSNLGRQ